MRFLILLVIATYTQTVAVDAPVNTLAWCGAQLVYTQDDDSVTQPSSDQEKVLFIRTDNQSVYYLDHFWQLIEGSYREVGVSPANSRVVYIMGDTSLRTNDCGITLHKINTTGLNDFQYNKANWRMVLATKPMNCEPQDMDCRPYFRDQLYYTLDGGENWLPSFKNVREVYWDKRVDQLDVPDGRIIFSMSVEGKTVIAYSDDFENHTILAQAQGLYQTKEYLFILNETHEAYELLYGSSQVKVTKLEEIQLPIKIFKEFSYTILDTEGGTIYVAVTHSKDKAEWTNIYMSDNQGKNFNISLTNNIRSKDTGSCDFEKLLGLKKTFIANIFLDQETRQTRITFDGGDNWQPIPSPTKNSEGETIICAGECSLHLMGRTQSFKQSIYTTEQAPGIALGVGNIGVALTEYEENLNTYLTIDGGHTWTEIMKGAFLYEITDFGGLIVLAHYDQLVNFLFYSIDYGISFKKYYFTDDLFTITNIATEVSGSERQFLVYGRGDNGQGIALLVDLSKEFSRQCAPQDYTLWKDNCINGYQQAFQRRKNGLNCYNKMNSMRYVPCECTRENWECDKGFELQDGECIATEEIMPQRCLGKYMKSRGYVKVGNCQDGVNLGPIQTPCPEDSRAVFYFAIIVIGITSIVFCYRSLLRKEKKKKVIYDQMNEDEDDEDEVKL